MQHQGSAPTGMPTKIRNSSPATVKSAGQFTVGIALSALSFGIPAFLLFRWNDGSLSGLNAPDVLAQSSSGERNACNQIQGS
jgi:hypothetical protein